MITTRRDVNEMFNAYATEQEKNVAVNNGFAERAISKEKVSDTERTRKNLEYIMNYDLYIAKEREEAAAATINDSATVVEEVSKPEIEQVEINREDIEPSSTTMQFMNESATELMGDIKQEKKEPFRLTKKGKVMIALYAFAVTVIMALIILNTTVLSNLSGMINHKTNELQTLKTSYRQVVEELDNVSNEETISKKAVEFGMTK